MEREIVETQKTLEQLAIERSESDEIRHKRQFEKVLLRQQAAVLKRRSRQVQTDLNADLIWLGRLLALEDGEADGGELRSRLLNVKRMLEDDLNRETRREADMDDLLA